MVALRWPEVWPSSTWVITWRQAHRHTQRDKVFSQRAVYKFSRVFQMGFLGNTSKNIWRTKCLEIVQWWFCRRRPSVSELLSQMQALHQHKRQRVFGGYISILIHFGISIHFAHIWSDRGQMLDVKTTLRRFSLRGCANSNKCSWRTAKAPVTQLRRDCLTDCFGERLSQAGSLPVRLKASHHPGTIVCKSQYLRCFRQVQKFQWNSIHFPRFFQMIFST